MLFNKGKFKIIKIEKICLMINKFLARKCLFKNFILQALFQSAQHFHEKKGKDTDPFLSLTDPDADPG
jgi:hypothetical protein